MNLFRFIDAERAYLPVSLLCRVLGVSRGGYYAWRERLPSRRSREDAILTGKIREVHERSRETYGYPRVHAELRALGERCGRRRVARLMREAGLRGCLRGRKRRTTRRDPHAAPARDLVRRRFSAAESDRLWLADITYVKTDEGFLHLAFILDAHSRRIVGWSMAEHLPSRRVGRRRPGDGRLKAKALRRADPPHRPRLAVHGPLLREEARRDGHRALDGKDRLRPGQRYGGELRLDAEGRAGGPASFPHRGAARVEIFEYIEGFYNRTRRHSALGYESPRNYEATRMEEVVVA